MRLLSRIWSTAIMAIATLLFDYGVLGALVIVGGLGAPLPAHADMVLSDVIVDLQAPGEMRYDVEVWNSGGEPLYIEIKASEVLQPDVDESIRKELVDPRKASLLVSPRRLVVPPDERKRVRLVARKVPTERDAVYRVSFIPKENEARTNKELAFKVLIGYEVLVLIRPPDARPELAVRREGNHIHFENAGKSSILLRKLEYCGDSLNESNLLGGSDDSQCEELPGNRLYAGEVWDVDLPGAGPVRVFESYRSENKVREY